MIGLPEAGFFFEMQYSQCTGLAHAFRCSRFRSGVQPFLEGDVPRNKRATNALYGACI